MVATQLLSSMVNNPIPTRAEIVDIMTAVKSGADSLLLTDETTIGNYPVEAVEWLNKIANMYEYEPKGHSLDLSKFDERMKFAIGICELANKINAKIVVFTKSGLTAIRLSRYRGIEILAGTPSQDVKKFISLLRNVNSIRVNANDYNSGMYATLQEFIKEKKIKNGDYVILTYGLQPNTKEYEHVIKLIKINI